MTSDTPRTDKALLTYTGGEYVTFPRGLRCVVDADFARQLERELVATQTKLKECLQHADAMAHAIRYLDANSDHTGIGEADAAEAAFRAWRAGR